MIVDEVNDDYQDDVINILNDPLALSKAVKEKYAAVL